jgi:hypothetical protein
LNCENLALLDSSFLACAAAVSKANEEPPESETLLPEDLDAPPECPPPEPDAKLKLEPEL